jgi:hypothetical protein
MDSNSRHSYDLTLVIGKALLVEAKPMNPQKTRLGARPMKKPAFRQHCHIYDFRQRPAFRFVISRSAVPGRLVFS